MDDISITRRMIRRAIRGTTMSTPLAKDVLAFGRLHGRALFDITAAEAKRMGWAAMRRAVANDLSSAAGGDGVQRLAAHLAALLRLDPIDSAVVAVLFALDRLRLPGELRAVLARHGNMLPAMIGEVAGAEPQDAERRVRLHPLIRMGLVGFAPGTHGELRLEFGWALENLLDRLPETEEGIVEAMVGPRQSASLPMSAFAHVDDADFLRRLLAGAQRERAGAVNILIHGPPGTGKTEFARTLAEAAGLRLIGAGEAVHDGGEPNRRDRIAALQMGQRLLARDAGVALLFDEMEDLIGDAQPTQGDWMRGRQGSKLFVNRMLETNPVPVIWTTNVIGNIDPAILRRMSFVLKLDLPSRDAAMRMLGHVAEEERVVPGTGWSALVDVAPEAASVLRVAARSARFAGEDDGGLRPARSLVQALRYGSPLPIEGSEPVDLDLFETDRPLDALFENVRGCGRLDISLLLTGVPGTGKTALAHHFARTLDRPLLVRRTSDLLSKWVGETEKRIAGAFAEASQRGAVLLFDEVDSLLFDRSTARTSWEVSQVNELLTWLDRHPLPVVAATNHAHRLDPATLRRFVFKLELRTFGPERAARAFERFVMPAPAALASMRGLTAGDMALVARQLRFTGPQCADRIVDLLRAELAVKPGAMQPIGFG